MFSTITFKEKEIFLNLKMECQKTNSNTKYIHSTFYFIQLLVYNLGSSIHDNGLGYYNAIKDDYCIPGNIGCAEMK
jgi:hypothetical protein